MRNGDMGWMGLRGRWGGVVGKRLGTGRHWRPHSHKYLCNGQLKDLELDKAGFRSNTENKEIVSHK